MFDRNDFSKSLRPRGNFPNNAPSATAGVCFDRCELCTPVMRANSLSKCASARESGSPESR